ncbi:MAG: hypothetical protein GY715_14825 [Planctomycetes bacterium]|nr:hypothetical protein [Planctomycetota bacterium]
MDAFFRFDCACEGEYTIDMCDSSGDAYIRIYTEGCGWSEGTEFAVDDDSCPGSPPNADPQLTVVLEVGTSYWIEVGTWRPDPPWAPPPNSPYTLRISACTPCTGDVNGDLTVSFADVLALIAAWGPCPAGCPQDLNGNKAVDFADILVVIAGWGPC